MKTGAVVVLCSALALTAGVATAAAGGGNSGAAKRCQKGGWQDLRRADQTPFRNQGDCVSYAAHGGTLVPTTIPAAAQLCRSLGGSFAFIALPGVLWQCGDWPFANTTDQLEKHAALTAQCLADGGTRVRTSIINGRGVSICEAI